jgi:small subunit ribosomal protein S17
MQLGKSMFQGAAVQSRPVTQPRLAAAAIMPIRAAQSLQGVVVSTNGDKTAVVSVNNPVVHPIYKKSVKRNKKYICHVEQQCAVGDIVTLAPSRPLSKSKRFAVSAIVKKGIN